MTKSNPNPNPERIAEALEKSGLTVSRPDRDRWTPDFVAVGTAFARDPVTRRRLGKARTLAVLVDHGGQEPDEFDLSERVDIAKAHGMTAYVATRGVGGSVQFKRA